MEDNTQPLSERIGHPVVVENRASVTGNVGVGAGVRAPADGYTVTMISNQNIVANLAEAQPTFSIAKDLEPVTLLAEYYTALLVKSSLPVTNMAELIALIKSQPGKITLGSGGIGSSGHVAMGLLTQKTGAEVLHVPYKGEGPLIAALLGGEVDMAFITLSGAVAQLKTGRVKGLGITSAKRVAALPDMPTIAETVPGFFHAAWLGMSVPIGTPRDHIAFLSKELTAILQTADVHQTLTSRSYEIIGSTPEQFRQKIQSETEVLGKLAKQLNLKNE
ncbi:Bug family tripartite tricarboxylate transporter substrate binding protein [Hydrogenophaga sp. BPS33]|uniref:Bug family tripartite tricarboxylate transporter substrate binding protein n=1 Tax=Hydrogenophaga sp. BPS33 TaxID=2651974 RepID=UPI0022A6D13E|nr:tripartite tricarboxylate transporter substrate binding protein [Hydrogenophaga sp. BPS33]